MDEETSTGNEDPPKVIYLSPFIDDVEEDVIIALIAHELAHAFCGHKLHNTDDQYWLQEDAAWNLVNKWGFDKEAKAHEDFYEKKDPEISDLE